MQLGHEALLVAEPMAAGRTVGVRRALQHRDTRAQISDARVDLTQLLTSTLQAPRGAPGLRDLLPQLPGVVLQRLAPARQRQLLGESL